MTQAAAITISDIARTFTTGRRRKRREVVAVDGISLEVKHGERLAFIGPNGAGKSTTIKILTGLLHPTSGSATVLGLTPWTDRKHLATRIGTLFGQRSQLWQELPATDSYNMLGSMYGLDDDRIKRRVRELGELLDAGELFDRPLRTLSLGQRMRCELTAVMLHEPSLLFLDEPSIGLDLVGKKLFRELLVQLNSELGTTVFLTSHDVSDIEMVADRAVIINDGALIYDDTVARMKGSLLSTKTIEAHYGNRITVDQIKGLDKPGVTIVESITDSNLGSVRIEIDTGTASVDSVMSDLMSIGPLADLSVLDPPLEHVISEIYEGRL